MPCSRSSTTAGSRPTDAVLVLREPQLEADSLTYGVEILDGTLPARYGPCALFIDVFGRPLAPVARAAG